ncbi:hypothetical protein [Pseudonocardia parietis]|uniref:Uncharacterized protein n=1 Tax=Pseudonocardia parietis TaxID=570936 RepID=A0ABS4VMH6_9PSEU|nr:hypothetical protein [Pseudonocardia parietis]MBP2365133.1 hypothetical protein [Pseudonocardia parietis]
MTRRRTDMRRGDPEPPWAGPEVKHTPGLARNMMVELAPLLAEDGIIVDADGEIVSEVPDMETLQRAMARAVERQNLALFTPVGADRELAADVLREVTEALDAGHSTRACDVLDAVVPESPEHDTATVAGVTGVALGLLDAWLSGRDPHAPGGLAERALLPGGHWTGERAAVDILTLARKARAFRSLHKLTVTHGGHGLLYGAALALAAATTAWAHHTGTALEDLAATAIR